jgi:hypothetical protein
MTDNHTERNAQYATLLLSPLRREPGTPSRIDVAQALAEGRRRRRVRWWAGGTAIIALTATAAGGGTLALGALDRPHPVPSPRLVATASPSVTVAARPAGPAGCTITRLPTDGLNQALVTGGDPSGELLVGRLYPTNGSFHRPLVVWKNGKIADRVEMPGSDQSLDDINSHGVAVGTSFGSDDRQRAYVVRSGKVTALKGGEAGATAINDAGVIVGTVGTALDGQPARWSSATVAPVRLALPSGAATGEASDIDEDGTVLGTIQPKRGTQTGYLWMPDGTGRRMPLPTVDGAKANYFWPESIRNGWVAGRAGVDDSGGGSTFTAFRYRVDTGRYERVPDSAGMPARVAANGWVAGESLPPTIYSEAGVLHLPKYPAKGAVDYYLTSFSEDGLVVGGYVVGDGVQNQPLMWRCR